MLIYRTLAITLLVSIGHAICDVPASVSGVFSGEYNNSIWLALHHHFHLATLATFLQLAAINLVGTALLLAIGLKRIHIPAIVAADFIYLATVFVAVEWFDSGGAFTRAQVGSLLAPYLAGLALSILAVLAAAHLAGPMGRRLTLPYLGIAAIGLATPLAFQYRPHVEKKPAEGPNVILVVVDTLRADHMGLYGYERPTTPFIDKFVAERGILFERAYSQFPGSTVSHATIYTGCYAFNHRATIQGMSIPTDVTLVSEIFDQLGYHTAAFHDHRLLGAGQGFAQGFDTFVETHDPVLANSNPYVWRRELHLVRIWDLLLRRPTVTTTALDWLKNPQEPFFTWLHWTQPHPSYKPPREFIQRFSSEKYTGKMTGKVDHGGDYASLSKEDFDHMVVRYDGEIAWMDHDFELLIDQLREAGSLDNTIIAFTADHGTGLGDHGFYFDHHGAVYEESIHVPLFFVPAGGIEPQRAKDVVELVDVASTLLSLAGVEGHSRFCDGQDLSRIWTEGSRSPGIAFSWFTDHLAAVDAEYKYIQNGFPPTEVELYSLVEDPEELVNLADTEQRRRLADEITSLCESSPAALEYCKDRSFINTDLLEPEMVNQLRALGYIE